MGQQVPLPTGLTGDSDIPELQESLTNLFNPGDNTILKTPGIDAFATGISTCRASIDFQDEHYQVSGTNLIKISETGATTTIGTIDGTADCVMSKSFIALIIIVKGGNGYVFEPSSGLSQITDPDFKPSIDVASINQRFVFVPEDGGTLFFTDVNSPSDIPALNFFDAEFLPDKNTGIVNLRNDLYVGGVNSFEVFRDTGPTDNPFIRVDGAAIETGYVAARAIYRDTFVFLGKDRDGSYAFHAMSAGDAPKISIPFIDEVLNNEYTKAELEACTSLRFTWKGVDMVAFRLARDTFLFYGAGWSYLQTGIDGLNVHQTWDVKFLTFSYGKYITGSATSSAIGKLSISITEFGAKIERVIETFVKADSDTYFPIDNIFLKCITGTTATEGTISLQVSKDSQTYGPQVPRSLGKQGKTQQQMAWYGGVGVFESYCGVRLRTTADVNFSVQGLLINGGD